MSNLFPTALQTRQLVTFFDPSNPGLMYFQPRLNPSIITRKVTSVRKYQKTINGTSIITGNWEYPPQELSMNWNQIDFSDYDLLREYSYIYPIVFIDNNDQGFLGTFVFDTAEQIPNLSRNVWAVKGSFLVQAPHDGLTTILPQLAGPTISLAQTSGGYMPTAYTLYFWSTATTPWGESVAAGPFSITTNAASAAISATWANPTSNWYRTTKLYWNTTNNSATATQLMETEPGQTGSFTVYGQYVQYSITNPPAYGTAYTGHWSGGLWTVDP